MDVLNNEMVRVIGNCFDSYSVCFDFTTNARHNQNKNYDLHVHFFIDIINLILMVTHRQFHEIQNPNVRIIPMVHMVIIALLVLQTNTRFQGFGSRLGKQTMHRSHTQGLNPPVTVGGNLP